MGSLPLIFRHEALDFPVHKGYLKPDPDKSNYWVEELAKLGSGLKVGIAWRGGVPRTRQSMRSIPLAQWSPLLQCQGVQFVSLQHGRCDDEIANVVHSEKVEITHWQHAIDDCYELAALIDGLDLVVTVCGTVVHLAGAVGQAAWVFVPACPEWRYGETVDTMPWYPSVRLFRQELLGDWGTMIANVRRELSAMVRQRA